MKVLVVGASGGCGLATVESLLAGGHEVTAFARRHRISRLLVQSSFGVGPTQIIDTEAQESEVRDSGLDWIIVQPVALSDGALDAAPYVSLNGDTRSMKVSRRQVGACIANLIQAPGYAGQTITLSAAGG
jgi:uncharacterized protein YbjT (DUF2867 family)